MNAKSMLLVALVAAVLGVSGWFLGTRSDAASGDPSAGGLLLPELVETVNDAMRVEVKTADGGFAVQRTDDGWGLESKGGFPVKMEEVRKLLIALTELEKREEKTSDPERYSKLEVEDVDAEGAKSKLVTAYGPADEVLASLIVGKRRGGRGPDSLYARRAGDEASWLVDGSLNLPTDGDAWLDKQVLPLERDRVRAIEIQHPDGEVVFVAEKEEADSSLEVWDVPEGRELKYETVASGLGTALQYLNFTDVVPAGDFERPATQPVLTRIWTWDGERVTVELFTKPAEGEDAAETYWAIFHADEDPAGPPRLAMEVPPPPGEDDATEENAAAGENDATGENAAAGEEASATAVVDPAETRARIAEHAKRVGGWVYQLAPYAKGNLAKRMEDLTKEIEPPAVEEVPLGPLAPEVDTTDGTVDEPAVDEPPTEEPPIVDSPIEDPAVVDDGR